MHTLAPQGAENPIYWHLTKEDNLMQGIEETAEAGFGGTWLQNKQYLLASQ